MTERLDPLAARTSVDFSLATGSDPAIGSRCRLSGRKIRSSAWRFLRYAVDKDLSAIDASGPARKEGTVTYGVTVQTLDRTRRQRHDDAARRGGQPRPPSSAPARSPSRGSHCTVLVDHAVPCPGFVPSAQALPLD